MGSDSLAIRNTQPTAFDRQSVFVPIVAERSKEDVSKTNKFHFPSRDIGVFAAGALVALGAVYLSRFGLSKGPIVEALGKAKHIFYKYPMNGCDVHLENYVHLPVKLESKVLPVFRKPPEQYLKVLEEKFDVVPLWDYKSINEIPEVIFQELNQAEVALLHGVHTLPPADTTQLLQKMPNLKLAAYASAGARHDMGALPQLITTNAPDIQNQEIAYYTLGHIFGHTRGNFAMNTSVLEMGRLDYTKLSVGVSEQSIGIAGLGGIGSTIEHMLKGIKIPVSYFARSKKAGATPHYPNVIDLAQNNSVVVNSLSFTEATRGIYNADFFDALGKNSSSARRGFVNIGRGEHVDEHALLAWLKADPQNHWAHLDVVTGEPNNLSPALLEYAKEFGNLTFSHHNAAGTEAIRNGRMWDLGMSNLLNYAAGQGALTPMDRTPQLKPWLAWVPRALKFGQAA